jgi:uncharacterized membrane protein
MSRVFSKLLGKTKPVGAAQLQREKRQLHRLETLIDGVFALVIVLITVDVPLPAEDTAFELVAYLTSSLGAFAHAALGIAVLLVYWFQNNLLLGNLARTDAKHATLSIFQVFLTLLYLITVSLGSQVGNEPLVLAAQSTAAALLGFVAAGAWWYASHGRRLLTVESDDSEVAALRLRVLAEPLTALLTLALAFVSPLAWELGWLAYPLVAFVLRRLGLEYAQDSARDQDPAGSDQQ